MFAVVVGAFWLFVAAARGSGRRQRCSGASSGKRDEDDADGDDVLVERQPEHDSRRLEGSGGVAGGGMLRPLAHACSSAPTWTMPPVDAAGHCRRVVDRSARCCWRWVSPLPVVSVPLGLAAAWIPIA